MARDTKRNHVEIVETKAYGQVAVIKDSYLGLCEVPEFAGFRVMMLDDGGDPDVARTAQWLAECSQWPELMEIEPDPEPQKRMSKDLAKRLDWFKALGYVETGRYLHGAKTRPGLCSAFVGMVHLKDRVYLSLWDNWVDIDEDRRELHGDGLMFFEREFEDGSHLALFSERMCGITAGTSITAESPIQEQEANGPVTLAGTPAGTVLELYCRSTMDMKPNLESRYHALAIKQSGEKTAKPVMAEGLVPQLQSGYARRREVVIANAKRNAKTAIENMRRNPRPVGTQLRDQAFNTNKKKQVAALKGLVDDGVFRLTVSGQLDDQEMIAAWERFMKQREAICGKIKKMSVEAGLESAEDFEELQGLTETSLRDVMRLDGVEVRKENGTAMVVMGFDVLWDPEHGLRVRVDLPELTRTDY